MHWTNWLLAALAALFVLRWIWLRRGVVHLTAADLQRRLQAGEKVTVVDVREPGEFAAGHIAGARSLPLSTLPAAASGLSRDAEIALICASGNRSLVAFHRLKAAGFTNLRNVPGGMAAWRGPVRR